ncbi:MAG: thiamine phosphate synthase [Candidatus Acidiferrum sp.]
MTDRKALAGSAEEQIRSLLEKIESAAKAGVDWIQVREKDLSGRALAALVGEVLPRVPRTCRVLINDRLDLACSVRAGGVHLGGKGLPADEAKRFVRERKLAGEFLVGVSAHSVEAARRAEQEGGDYVIFGPVYETPSKIAFGLPQGVDRLAEVCRSVAVPVFAIGGITMENVRDCGAAGAAGIAAIRLFQDATDVAAVVRALREV